MAWLQVDVKKHDEDRVRDILEHNKGKEGYEDKSKLVRHLIRKEHKTLITK